MAVACAGLDFRQWAWPEWTWSVSGCGRGLCPRPVQLQLLVLAGYRVPRPTSTPSYALPTQSHTDLFTTQTQDLIHSSSPPLSRCSATCGEARWTRVTGDCRCTSLRHTTSLSSHHDSLPRRSHLRSGARMPRRRPHPLPLRPLQRLSQALLSPRLFLLPLRLLLQSSTASSDWSVWAITLAPSPSTKSTCPPSSPPPLPPTSPTMISSTPTA